MSRTFSIGCDPEFFLMKNGKPISAIGKVGGTKQQPLPISPNINSSFCVQEDNVAVEFNIAPAYNSQEFIQHIRLVMNHLQKKLKGYEFSQDSSLIFPKTQPKHPKALEFGCDPDYNAWTKDMNPRPEAVDQSLRSAGGHVHVGTKEDPIEVIRAMDIFLGVPSVKKDPNGARRRELYGAPGAFRIKPFGCEYRTLSNFWIFKDELIQWVYEQTAKAIDFVSSGEVVDIKHAEAINNCIIKSDMDAYEYLRETYRFE